MNTTAGERSSRPHLQFGLGTLLLVMFAAAVYGMLVRLSVTVSNRQDFSALFLPVFGALQVLVLLLGLTASLKRVKESPTVFRLAALACALSLLGIVFSQMAGAVMFAWFRRYQPNWLWTVLAVFSYAGLVLHVTALIAFLGAVFRRADPAPDDWLPSQLNPLTWLRRAAKSPRGEAVLCHLRELVPPGLRRFAACRDNGAAEAAELAEGAIRESRGRAMMTTLVSEIGLFLLALLIGGVYRGIVALTMHYADDMRFFRIPAGIFPGAVTLVTVLVLALGLTVAWRRRKVAPRTLRPAAIAFGLLLCTYIIAYGHRLVILTLPPRVVGDWETLYRWVLVPESAVQGLLSVAGLALLLAAIHRERSSPETD
jgi:hypothetical protein